MPPRDYTKYKPQQVIQALRESHGMVHVAAKQLHCAPTTLYKMIDRYVMVRQAKQNEEEMMLDAAELHVYKAVMAGEMPVVMWFLKLKGKKRGYVERVETTGADGGPLRYVIDIGEDGKDSHTTPSRDGGAKGVLD